MKVWLKYVIGIALGVIASVLLPLDTPGSQATLDFIVNLVIRFGRYAIMPMMFFSIATASYKLHDEKMALKAGFWTFGTIIFSSLLMVLIGVLSSTLIKLPNIPITFEKVNEIPEFNAKSLLTALFPYNGINSLLESAFLLPGFFFAYLAGIGACADKNGSKHAVTIFDSLSRVCYQVMVLCTELLSVGLVAIMFKWTVDFVKIYNAKVYNPLFLMLLIDFILVAFVIYPLIIRFFCHDRHPYRVLYASISSILVAFISGDSNLVLPVSIRHGKESLGIRRRISATTFPLFSVFGRGGAALVETVSFVLILRSYSGINIDSGSVFWIASMSLVLSFALGNIPVGGPFFAITTMFSFYGGGYDAGYLLLKDAAPLICCFAAAFDAATAMWGTYFVGVKTGMVERKEVKRFI